MNAITPCLWYDGRAEEAANFYITVFSAGSGAQGDRPPSKILGVARYGEAGAEVSGPSQGSVMTVRFQREGREFMALNGGPAFTFSPAVSFMEDCNRQEEVDEFWDTLSEGGQPGGCGRLTDMYGVSWQIVPSALRELMQQHDPQPSERVMQALLQMNKLDIKGLQTAFDARA